MKRNEIIDYDTHFLAYNQTLIGAWSWSGGTTNITHKNMRLRGMQFLADFQGFKTKGIHKHLNKNWGQIIWS